MSGIDYSVWDHIEVSDDEDDTHPNIDTPSLFRWRHQVDAMLGNNLQQCRKQGMLRVVVATASVRLFLLEGCVLFQSEYFTGLNRFICDMQQMR